MELRHPAGSAGAAIYIARREAETVAQAVENGCWFAASVSRVHWQLGFLRALVWALETLSEGDES
ncbi:MAG: hypothetical protein AAGE52_01425 [Myxococcota bacterium]